MWSSFEEKNPLIGGQMQTTQMTCREENFQFSDAGQEMYGHE